MNNLVAYFAASSLVFHMSMVFLTISVARLLGRSRRAGLDVVYWPLGYVVLGLLARFAIEFAYSLDFPALELKELARVSAFLMTILSTFLVYSLGTFIRAVGRIYTRLLIWLPAILIAVSIAAVFILAPRMQTFELFETALLVFSYHVLMGYFYAMLGRVSGKRGYSLILVAYFSSLVTGSLAFVNLTSTIWFLSGMIERDTYVILNSISYFVLSGLSISMQSTVLRKPSIFYSREEGRKVQTAVAAIDEVLEAGLPYPSVIAFFGPAGSGRTTIVTKMALTRILTGEAVVYLSVDTSYASQSEKFAKLGADIEAFKNKQQLLIVDTSGTEGNIRLNPQDISIAFTELLARVKGLRKWIIIDSFTTLIEEFGQDMALKLLRTLCQKANAMNVGFLFTYNPYAFPTNITALVEDCVNGVIELAIEERKTGILRKIRVKWMAGYRPSGHWKHLEEII